jgi:excinuclease ABC subunit C
MSGHRPAILQDLRERIADLPTGPGVYLFKDAKGLVLYVGKAKSLRSRVASYFQPGADLLHTRGERIDRMIRQEVCDLDIIECDSEVDALLRESRLIKDIHPPCNSMSRDQKTFPYLQITTDEDFPRVSITRQPRDSGTKLYGPFVSPAELRAALPLMQRVFKFRTCNLDIVEEDESRRHVRPCILHAIKQCTAPCGARVARDDYRMQIKRLRQFLESKGTQLRRDLENQMKQAAAELAFERAAELRDELRALEGLQKRGLVDTHLQPEAFFVDPAEGLERLGELLDMDPPPRTIEGFDIAHLQGKEMCGSDVMFIDGKPLKNGYRRFRIKTVQGNDDYACMKEVLLRRYRKAAEDEEIFPDVVLIDGGKGQLHAAEEAFEELGRQPPALLSLAKQNEEIFIRGRDLPLRLPRRDPALRLLQYVRDEAHRFVQHYHHILRRKAVLEEDTESG